MILLNTSDAECTASLIIAPECATKPAISLNTDKIRFHTTLTNETLIAVFSNSFHAASFSVIFEKPLCTFANGNLGGRVSNLLGYVERREMDGGIIVPMADSPELCALIEHSKEFIDNILK